MKKWLLGFCLSFAASALFADALSLKQDSPDVYYVKSGDTLWDISNVFLDDPWHWPEIWHINPQVANPHLIFPGDKLALVEINGQKKLTVVEREGPSVKLSPGTKKLSPQVRTEALESAIPAIPLEKISAFLSKSRIVSTSDLEAAPYVIAGEDRRIISGAGDKMYARGDFSGSNKVFGIYRPGEVFLDPETKEPLGVQALHIGGGRLISKKGDLGTLSVNSVTQEVRIEDRLLPLEEKKITATFLPKAPNKEVKGQILTVENGVSYMGAMDVVAVNIGSRDSLEEGDILLISQRGELVNDNVRKEIVQLPDVRAGLMVIFRVFDKMAFGLVVSAERSIRLGDIVSNP